MLDLSWAQKLKLHYDESDDSNGDSEFDALLRNSTGIDTIYLRMIKLLTV